MAQRACLIGVVSLVLAATGDSTAGASPSSEGIGADVRVDAPVARRSSPSVMLVDEPPFWPNVVRRSVAGVDPAPAPGKRGRHGRPYHPAPRIVVDVVDADRGVAMEPLQRVARDRGYWPFRGCYEDGLLRQPPLEGKVFVRLEVSAEGGVERVSVLPSTLRDPVVALCVAREARHLSFAAPGSAQAAILQVTLSEGDEPVMPRPRVHNASGLLEALRAAWPAVRQCYADGLSLKPDAGGFLELRFRMFGDGQVADVVEVGAPFEPSDVTRCVVAIYRSLKLPPRTVATGGTDFVYALHFEAKDDGVPDLP